jgi:hypothetical protein
MDYSEIAYKIVNFVLNLKSGQSVLISCEIHNVFDNNEPLAQIPFLEELALVVRKNKGLPILDISTENLHKRFFEEILEDDPNISSELLNRWLDSADYFIDLGWRSNPAFYKSIPERSFKKLNLSNKDFEHLFEKKNKKLILLGYPTIGLAKYFNIDHHLLKKNYFQALNINYYDLKKRTFLLDDLMKKETKWNIYNESSQLSFEFSKESKYYYGEILNDALITLPTGFWTRPINISSISGSFFCEQVYHDQYVWKSIKVLFEKGKLISVETDVQQTHMNLLRTIFFDNIDFVLLNIGLNYSIKEKCFYHAFDSIKYKNVSLKIQTSKGQLIALAETAQIFYDKGKDILSEF